MNTGHLQAERAEKAQQEPTAEPLSLYGSHSSEHYIDALKDDGTDDGANFNVCKLEYPTGNTLSEEQRTVNAAELVKRWNAYPRLMEALKTIEAKLHEGDAEDGSDDGEFIQDVRNLHGDYIGQLSDLGTIARGAIAVAAK